MRINAEISMSELQGIISDAVAKEFPKSFPNGARVLWNIQEGGRDNQTVSVTAIPRAITATKD